MNALFMYSLACIPTLHSHHSLPLALPAPLTISLSISPLLVNHLSCLLILSYLSLFSRSSLSLSSPFFLSFASLSLQFSCLHSLFPFGCALLSLQMQQKVAYLEEQIRLATMEKDHVLSELLHAQEEAEQSKTAVHNLQTVLEQFQKGL